MGWRVFNTVGQNKKKLAGLRKRCAARIKNSWWRISEAISSKSWAVQRNGKKWAAWVGAAAGSDWAVAGRGFGWVGCSKRVRGCGSGLVERVASEWGDAERWNLKEVESEARDLRSSVITRSCWNPKEPSEAGDAFRSRQNPTQAYFRKAKEPRTRVSMRLVLWKACLTFEASHFVQRAFHERYFKSCAEEACTPSNIICASH